MTVTVQDTTYRHTGNGVTTVFSFGCRIIAADDLTITVDDEVVTSGFTVSGVGEATGGYVTFSSAPATGAAIIIDRILTLKRVTDYQQAGDFLSPVVNEDFDRPWMVLQQFKALLNRALKLPAKYSLSELFMPAPDPGKTLKWNETGTAIINSDNDPDTYADAAAASASAASISSGTATEAATSATLSATSASESASAAAASAASINPSSLMKNDSSSIYATAGGTANAITASFSPTVTSLTDGLTVYVRAVYANTTSTPTFQADSTTAKAIVKATGAALSIGDIAGAAHKLELQYDLTLDKWVLMNPATGGSVASTTVQGAMSAADKTKLDGIASGATAINLGTAAATTSGTSVDFTGIPATAKRFTVTLNGVSTNGSSPIVIRGITSGGAISSGYSSSGGVITGTTVNSSSNTTGFLLAQVVGASVSYSGSWTFEKHNGNVWVLASINQFGTAGLGLSAGVVDLGAALTGVRLTTVSGTDTFDAGTVNISWE